MVDFAGQFDEARVDAVFACLPCQIERVDRNAVTTQSWSWLVGDEAEGFGGGGFDHFVDADAHFVGHDLHFVDQPNIHCAVDVFQQLGHFGHSGGADRHQGLNCPLIECLPQCQAAWGASSNYFRNIFGAVARVSGVLAFW